jgi:Ca2+-binding EF-hand superfamily protein
MAAGKEEEDLTHGWPAPASVFSAEEVRGMRAAFDRFDAAGLGTIARSEVAGLVRAVGLEATEEEVDFWSSHKALDGRLDFAGSLAVLARIAGREDSEAAVRRMLAVFDTDGTGSIRVADLRRMLLEIGDRPLGPEELALADALLEYADPDDSGLVAVDDLARRLFADYAVARKMPKPDAAEAAKKKK